VATLQIALTSQVHSIDFPAPYWPVGPPLVAA
jgi:hypothetical protein